MAIKWLEKAFFCKSHKTLQNELVIAQFTLSGVVPKQCISGMSNLYPLHHNVISSRGETDSSVSFVFMGQIEVIRKDYNLECLKSRILGDISEKLHFGTKQINFRIGHVA